LEENDNKKKLQFQASPRTVHKRSSSIMNCYMPCRFYLQGSENE